MKTTTPTQFTQNKDKSFVIKLTLTQSEITAANSKVITKAQSTMDIKGFRPGKAPLDLVKERLNQSLVIEETLTQLLNDKYSHIIEEKHLHPIIQPQIKVMNPPLTFDKDWDVEITGSELPEIKLADKYVDEVKKINKSAKNDNDRLTQTLEVLVKNSTVDLPQILIDADVQNKLSQLVNQTQSAGLTVEAYLKSNNTTLEKYRTELEKQVKNEWITNLAIDAVFRENKLSLNQKEIDTVVAQNKELAKNLNLVYYLLTQQKVFTFLKTL